MDIVRNKDERAFVALQRQRQRLDGMDVEVGSRFVHQQEVRRVDEELDQVEPALLAAAQDGGLFKDLLFAEHE